VTQPDVEPRRRRRPSRRLGKPWPPQGRIKLGRTHALDAGELGGMIAALRKRPGHPWTPAEIDVFQQIAADIGRALHHARQFEAENRLVDELKALDRRKSTFIATVSHELRTPLTSIAGYTEILADAEAGPLTPKQQEFLDTISRNTARLRNLIEDLLTLSKIESGAFRTAMRPLKLADIITPAVTALKPIAVAAGLTLASTLPSDDDAPLRRCGR
jgi:two-component system phosphate regulon sensor histidine kinase PhoR